MENLFLDLSGIKHFFSFSIFQFCSFGYGTITEIFRNEKNQLMMRYIAMTCL